MVKGYLQECRQPFLTVNLTVDIRKKQAKIRGNKKKAQKREPPDSFELSGFYGRRSFALTR